MDSINGKVNNSNKMKTYAEGNNGYISPSSNSYLDNIKAEVETIDFDTDDIESEKEEEKVTPIKYSKNIWDSKDNPALYLNSNEFNISSESIGRYFYEIRSGISFGSVIINGERYIINSNGIEKSFDVKYTYDKEGEYVIKLDDIMYSKETLATFLTSKGIIQNSDEIAALTIM